MNIDIPSKTVFYTIEKAIKEYRRFAQGSLSEAFGDITVDQSLVLFFLDEYPNLTQAEIASMLFKDNASMTRMINLMVKKGYLERSINPEDRRRFALEITEKGREALGKLPPVISHYRQVALAGVTEEEIQQLEIILNKIIKNCQ